MDLSGNRGSFGPSTVNEDEERKSLLGSYNKTDYTGSQDEQPIIYSYMKREGEVPSKITASIRNVILVILNVLFNVTMNVVLPIYAGTMDVIGGDTYVVLSHCCIWFVVIFCIMTLFMGRFFDSAITLKPTASYKILFLMGLLTTLNGIFVVFSSPPDRCPPYLQGILSTMSIPYTIIFRIIILRKGIDFPRSIAVSAVVVGLFISAEPQIWGLDGSNSSLHQSTAERILWPLCFAIGFLPYGIMNVLCEKELKKGEGTSFSFITWTQIFQLATMFPMFWVDFVPKFGMADSPSDFIDRLHRGLYCSYSSDPTCNGLAWKAWLFYIAYCLANLFQFLLIQYAEGAVYAAVVQALISPLAALFWTLFHYDPPTNHFYWGPKFNETTVFTICGLCVMVPGIVLYNYFSLKAAKAKSNTDESTL